MNGFIEKIILDYDPKQFILKVFINISVEEAKTNEIFLISIIGRKDKGLGPLLNLTNGGDGGEGNKGANKGKVIGPHHTIEFKRLASERFMGDKNPSRTVEGRKRLSENRKGKKNSPESNAKRSIWSSNRKHTDKAKKLCSESKIGDKNPNFGKWNICNKTLNKNNMIFPKDFPIWKEKGWERGHIVSQKSIIAAHLRKGKKRDKPFSLEHKKRIGKNGKGRIYIHNKILNLRKRVKKDDIELYLVQGWEIGSGLKNKKLVIY
jgi:hypothetical protein